jgi:hypothetical protein
MIPHSTVIPQSSRLTGIVEVLSAHIQAQQDRLAPDIAAELNRIFGELRRLRDAVRRREAGA